MSADDKTRIINQRIHRTPASSTWEHEHRWGTALGDRTSLFVDRVDEGRLTVRYGNQSVEIRAELVQAFADMVAAAAAWSDPKRVER